jgi:hypothetical protein
VPSRIQTRITVFKIPKQPFYYHSDSLLGWGPRTSSGVDIEIIPHGRHRLLLREPYVRELAAALSNRFQRLQIEGRDSGHKDTQPTEMATASR